MPAEATLSDTSRHWLLVVEDESRLRKELVTRLAAVAADLGPVRAAASAEEATELCHSGAPHIAFIDIRLPGQSGLEFAQSLPEDTRLVFVTAHDQFAVDAFDQGAVDYLLKPIAAERLQRCVERLRHKLTPSVLQLRALLSTLPTSAPQPEAHMRWLAASTGRRTRLIPVQDVIYLQSDTKYTRVVSREGEHLVEEAIRTLLPRLDPAEFHQIHRSTVVNLREVLLVERDESGGGQLHFREHPDVLRVSAPYMRIFKAFLG